MFLALTITAALGGGIILGLIRALRDENKNAKYLRDRLLRAADNLREEQSAHRFWLAQAGEASRQVGEAYDEQESLRTELEEAEGAIRADSLAVDFLTEKVVDLVDEVADLEDELEDAEEESDDFEDVARVALEGWTRSDEISNIVLAWGERLLNMCERVEEGRI